MQQDVPTLSAVINVLGLLLFNLRKMSNWIGSVIFGWRVAFLRARSGIEPISEKLSFTFQKAQTPMLRRSSRSAMRRKRSLQSLTHFPTAAIRQECGESRVRAHCGRAVNLQRTLATFQAAALMLIRLSRAKASSAIQAACKKSEVIDFQIACKSKVRCETDPT